MEPNRCFSEGLCTEYCDYCEIGLRIMQMFEPVEARVHFSTGSMVVMILRVGKRKQIVLTPRGDTVKDC